MTVLPARVRAVMIGSGVAGCTFADYLARGMTGQAAGLDEQPRANKIRNRMPARSHACPLASC